MEAPNRESLGRRVSSTQNHVCSVGHAVAVTCLRDLQRDQQASANGRKTTELPHTSVLPVVVLPAKEWTVNGVTALMLGKSFRT